MSLSFGKKNFNLGKTKSGRKKHLKKLVLDISSN